MHGERPLPAVTMDRPPSLSVENLTSPIEARRSGSGDLPSSPLAPYFNNSLFSDLLSLTMSPTGPSLNGSTGSSLNSSTGSSFNSPGSRSPDEGLLHVGLRPASPRPPEGGVVFSRNASKSPPGGTPSPSTADSSRTHDVREADPRSRATASVKALETRASAPGAAARKAASADSKGDLGPGKPPHSYIALISMAILSRPEKKMILCDIYRYIRRKFEYYDNEKRSWRNSIRHNLSLNECFVKAGRADNGKGNYWAINPACEEDFAKGDYSKRHARRRARNTYRNRFGISSVPYAYRCRLGYVPMTSRPVHPGVVTNYHPYGNPLHLILPEPVSGAATSYQQSLQFGFAAPQGAVATRDCSAAAANMPGSAPLSCRMSPQRATALTGHINSYMPAPPLEGATKQGTPTYAAYSHYELPPFH